MDRRADGFEHEVLIVLPRAVVEAAAEQPLFRGILPSAAGSFPRAEGHFVERPAGIPEAIFILCTEGSGWVRLADRPRERVEAGTVLYLPAGCAHAYGADPDHPWTIDWFHARGSEIEAFAALLGLDEERPLLPMPAESVRELPFAGLLEPLSKDYTIARLLEAATQIRVLLVELIRLHHRGRSAHDPVERTILWMRRHLDERVQLAQLAQLAGLSCARYSALFRVATGYAPIDFFLRLKVRKACDLLDRTQMRIEEVSLAVGYTDAFYFSRLFRRIMAQSPRAYRATKKG